MAQPDKDAKKEAVRQKQADHFNDIKEDAQATAADPASTPEEVAEAEQTVADMEKNLARLNEKYGVTPSEGG